jgi:hypothetical protein
VILSPQPALPGGKAEGAFHDSSRVARTPRAGLGARPRARVDANACGLAATPHGACGLRGSRGPALAGERLGLGGGEGGAGGDQAAVEAQGLFGVAGARSFEEVTFQLGDVEAVVVVDHLLEMGEDDLAR